MSAVHNPRVMARAGVVTGFEPQMERTVRSRSGPRGSGVVATLADSGRKSANDQTANAKLRCTFTNIGDHRRTSGRCFLNRRSQVRFLPGRFEH